ncbi:MAG: polysaccharide biosynthesis tyrosine autokinase [Alphaproteobacteria bacterium]
MIALILLVLIERLDSGFRSAEQVESHSGLPALGLVPEIRSKKQRGDLQRYLREQPLSPYAESIRNLQVSLALADVDNPVKSIVVTAASPEEGKSTLAYSLAQTSARLGKKTVLVDCDLRRPVQHENAKLDRAPGLVELLAQQASMNDVLRKEQNSGMYIICAGEPAPNPPDLLASQHMRELIGKLSEQFDLVILDTPPVMAVSDARILGRMVDRVVMVVRWAKTRRESAVYTAKQLTEAGARVAGMVLTRVDIRKHADYGFADSGYFHKKYAKYYND